MKRKFIPVTESFAKWKSDSAYAAAYASLEGDFAPASSLIKARSQADITQEQVAQAMGTTQAADPEEGIRQGLADLAAGRTRPAREVFDEFRKKRSLSR